MQKLLSPFGCFLAVWCITSSVAYCAEDFWERDTLLMGGSEISLSIADDGQVMLALSEGTAYRSTDYGDTWQRLSFTARALAVSASYSEYIYVATTDSIYSSTDLGNTWTTLNVPFVTDTYYRVAAGNRILTYSHLFSVYPRQLTIFLFTRIRTGSGSDSLSTSMYSTINNGAIWDSLMYLPLYTPVVTFNKEYGTILLTGWRSGRVTGTGIRGIVMRSVDSAKTWQTLTTTLPSYVSNAVMFGHSDYMTAVQDEGIYKSIDSGHTWQPASSPVKTVLSLARHKGQLLAGTIKNLYISSDTGRTWNKSEISPKFSFLFSIVSEGDAVFLLPYSGIYRDRTFPSKFEDVGNQFVAGKVRSAALFGRSTMLASYRGGASITTDKGESWDKIGLVGYDVSTVGISSKGTLFAQVVDRLDNQPANEGTSSFMRSTDNGATWQDVYGIAPNGETYTIYPECFLVAGDTIFAGEAGILRSTDDGQTWRAVQGGGAMCLYRTRAGTYLAGSEGNIVRSTDGGSIFKPAAITLTTLTFITDIVQNPKTGRLFAAETGFCEYGLFYSDDDGATWQPHEWDGCAQKLAVDSLGNVYATSWYGIYRSTDNGATWEEVPSSGLAEDIGDSYGGLFGGSPYGAFLVGSDGRLYLGMRDGGLFRSTQRFPPVGVKEEPITGVAPVALQIQPNPFDNTTQLQWRLRENANVRIVITDALGRVASEVFHGQCNTGVYSADIDGSGLPIGVYYCRLETMGTVVTRQIALIR